MLNRRIIRGKVLQQIFAYKTCTGANAEILTEKLIEIFSPDLNSLEPQDTKKLEGLGKLALLQFNEYLKTGNRASEEGMPEEVIKATQSIMNQYDDLNKKDKTRILNRMVEDSEKISDHYLLVIQLIIELADKLAEHKKISGLQKNGIIQLLKQDAIFNQEITKRSITWVNDQDIVNELIVTISKDATLKDYKPKAEDEEGEIKTVLYILKTILFKNPAFHDFFEGKLLHWQEDKAAVKDLVEDTLKDFWQTKSFKLRSVSKNWDDDKVFMKELYLNTIEKDRYLEELITPKLKNWDISRLTVTDSIIMKMCIEEMIHFFNIPVKVSLNEYIELSKKYSTPKSKTLINGVIDNLSEDLIKSGIIKKSGRGLIDNK